MKGAPDVRTTGGVAAIARVDAVNPWEVEEVNLLKRAEKKPPDALELATGGSSGTAVLEAV